MAGLLSIDDYSTNRSERISNYATGKEVFSRCKKSAILNKLDNKLEWWRDKNAVCLIIQNQNSIFDVTKISELGAIQ